MRSVKYLIFTLLISFISIFHVYASCTDEEISSLKELVKDIKITYKHLGKVEDEVGIYYNRFEVNVKNVPDDFYILAISDTYKLQPKEGIITEIFNNGTWDFNIYSNKCNEKISEIKVFIPKFNTYSLDPLCEGIDGQDFPLCGKYYEYDVSYNDFEKRVKHYRATYNINNIDNNEDDKPNDINMIINEVVKFISKYKLYIISSLFIILLTLVITIIIKKRKSRGVLK